MISRIASLTQSLKPYKYLKNDKIIPNQVSPERGQLLSALLNFELDSLTYVEIFKKSNFQNLELKDADLSNITIKGIDLSFSNFENTNFSNSVFQNVRMENTIMKNGNFIKVKFISTYIIKSDFALSDVRSTNFQDCFFSKTI